jgi:uncharacterized protein YhfF/GNAT superfamily N-acetyltransferase
MPHELPRWGFAAPGPLRDRLTRLALSGAKTATTGLLAGYEIDGVSVPAAGDRQLIVDSAERPVAVVETTSAAVLRLADVDDAHAIDEGEGYADAAEFRTAHERHWAGMLGELRAALGDPSFALTDDTPVVAERFRVVEVLGPAPGAGFVVRPAMPADRALVDTFLAGHDTALVARRDEVVDARRHPALIAERQGSLAGVATWIHTTEGVEVLTLHAGRQWQGAGSALIAAARTLARAAGSTRVWLITTNDNLDALRFYQRRGFRLVGVDAGAVDRSRSALKPGIPAEGLYGIRIRDELELEMTVEDDA